LSIRLRLTIWYTAVLAVTMLLFSVFLYFLLARNLTVEINKSIVIKGREVISSVRVIGPPHQLRQVVLPDVDVFATPDIFLQVVDSQGTVVARSQNLGGQNLPVNEAMFSETGRTGPFFETATVGNERVRLYNSPLNLKGNFIGILQVGRSLRSMETTLNRLRFLLFFGGGLLLFLTASLGWFLAGLVLKPISRITKTAAAISQDADLNRRIAYLGPGDELGRLAATINSMLARLQVVYSRLEEAYAGQRRFVADASHELRTPLTTIRGNVELLQKMGDTHPVEREEALADIACEAERMSRLVNDLLVLARADAGQHLEKQPVVLGGILNEVARQAKQLQGGVNFRTEGLELLGEIKVMGRADALRQLFFILLDNAFKYTLPEGKVALAASVPADRVKISVIDTGSGIAPEDLSRIFERFYRADKARRTGGSGLGLSIASWIAEEHQGKLEVQSKLGEGSTFTVLLPVAKLS
jgi:two-component system OmpR family sensor kinase